MRESVKRDREFVRIWTLISNEGGTYDDVAEALGVTKQAVAKRAQRLRKHGTELPALGRSSPGYARSLTEFSKQVTAAQMRQWERGEME